MVARGHSLGGVGDDRLQSFHDLGPAPQRLLEGVEFLDGDRPDCSIRSGFRSAGGVLRVADGSRA